MPSTQPWKLSAIGAMTVVGGVALSQVDTVSITHKDGREPEGEQ